jgi:hypothetical protein
MAAVAGIKFIKDTKKNNRYVTIDLKKHSTIVMPLLKKLGAIDEAEDDFDKEWKKGISGEKLIKNIHVNLEKLFKAKND